MSWITGWNTITCPRLLKEFGKVFKKVFRFRLRLRFIFCFGGNPGNYTPEFFRRCAPEMTPIFLDPDLPPPWGDHFFLGTSFFLGCPRFQEKRRKNKDNDFKTTVKHNEKSPRENVWLWCCQLTRAALVFWFLWCVVQRERERERTSQSANQPAS